MVFSKAEIDRRKSNLIPGNKTVVNKTELEKNALETNVLEKSWKEGRRIVELELISNALICQNCKTDIYLRDIISEKISGLASILTVKCLKCDTATKVPTGKRHRLTQERGPGRFDVNTKLAAGKFL